MTVYAMVEIEITDVSQMTPYFEEAHNTITAHGGKLLVGGGNTEVAEGGLGEYPLKTLLEFPSMAEAKGWYNSPEYQAILPYRTKYSKCNFVWVEGIDFDAEGRPKITALNLVAGKPSALEQ